MLRIELRQGQRVWLVGDVEGWSPDWVMQEEASDGHADDLTGTKTRTGIGGRCTSAPLGTRMKELVRRRRRFNQVSQAIIDAKNITVKITSRICNRR